MIQRRQSIWLALSILVIASLFWLKIGTINVNCAEAFKDDPTAQAVCLSSSPTLDFHVAGFYQTSLTDPSQTIIVAQEQSLLWFTVLILAMNLFSIFLFKKLALQMRLTLYVAIFLLGLQGLFFFMLHAMPWADSCSYGFAMFFPLIAFILQILAFRDIRADKLLLESLNRIR